MIEELGRARVNRDFRGLRRSSPPPRSDRYRCLYAPAEIAARIEKAGIGKARLPAMSLVALAMLAGAFIAFGAMLYTLVMTGSGLGLRA